MSFRSTGRDAVKIALFLSFLTRCTGTSPGEITPANLLALEKSAIGTVDNPEKRASFEARMLTDPNTGAIPRGIRIGELRFSRNLPRRTIATARKSDEGWDARGPFNVGGRTRALAIDVTDEEVYLAGGVSGGMWRTDDGGVSWTKATTSLNLHSTTCIAQDTRPGKTNTWYYGTGEIRGNTARSGPAPFRGDGIFKSTNGGRSWDLLPSTSDGLTSQFNTQFRYVWEVVINHTRTDVDEIFAATFGAILRSQDGGDTWDVVLGDTLINLPDTANLNNVTAAFYSDVAITSSGILYAAFDRENSPENGGIYRSVDGVNWINITPQNLSFSFRRVELGVSASNPNIVYVLVDADSPQIWRYDDRNPVTKWTDLSANIPTFDHRVGDFDAQNSYNLMISVHPGDPNIVYLGGTNLYRSVDGFSTAGNTDWIGGYNPDVEGIDNYPGHHPDQHVFRFFSSNPNRALSAHDGGISRTENNLDSKVTWTTLNNGFVTSQFYSVNLDRTASNSLVIGGLQDNGSQATTSTNFFSDWQRVLGADGGYCAVAGNGTYFYFSFQDAQIFRVTMDDQFRISDFTRVDPVGGGESADQSYLFINPFELDPVNNNVMYLAGGDAIWRNSNLSQIPSQSRNKTVLNWSELERSRVSNGQISTLAVSRQPRHIVYYGTTSGEVFRIDGVDKPDYTIQPINHSEFPNGGYVANIAVNPLDANHMVVVFSNYNVQSLFLSLDGGITFETVGGNLEENAEDGSGNGPSIRWVEIVPMVDGSFTYLAASSIGLFATSNLNGNETVWSMEGSETIGNVVIPMVRYRSIDGMVAVATHGNGVYTGRIAGVLAVENLPQDEILALGQNYPNPFNELTTIPYDVPQDGVTRVKIYDTFGREIKTILFATQFAGSGEITWDGTNVNGVPVADGIYLYRLEYTPNSGGNTIGRLAGKMILQR